MRNFKKPSKDGVLSSFAVSDHSGPLVHRIKYGTDNLITKRKRPFKYTAAKPYTSIVTPFMELKPVRCTFSDGAHIHVKPPESNIILQSFREDIWRKALDPIMLDLDQYAENNAIEKALAYGDLLMYVTASEAKQTMLMVRKLFSTIFNAVLDIYKQARKLNLVATIDVLSNLWLEYRYGWRPFIGEVESLHKVLTDIRVDGIKSVYGQSRRTVPPESIDLGTTVCQTDLATFTYKGILTPSICSAKAGFNYLNADDSRNDDWFSLLGLDLETLLSTVWDMIPFSFVLDMFLNIGSILKTRNSSAQVDSFNFYRTRHIEGTVELRCENIEINKSATAKFSLEEHIKKFPLLKRGRLADFYNLSEPGNYFHDLRINSKAHLPSTLLNSGTGYLPYIMDDFHGPWNGYMLSTRDLRINQRNRQIPFSNLNLTDLGTLYRSFDRTPSGSIRFKHQLGTEHLDSHYRISCTQVLDNFLDLFDFTDLTDYEIAQFLQGMISPVDNYSRQKITSWTDLLTSKNPSIRWSTFSFESGLGGAYGEANTPVDIRFGRHVMHNAYVVGHIYPQFPSLEEVPLGFDYTLPCKVFTRDLKSEFNFKLTIDTDLADAQFADLGALAWSLTSRFR